MLLKDIFEHRWYGPRKRNVDVTKQEHRNRISKKPTQAKRDYDNLKNAKKRKLERAVINQKVAS